MNSIRSILNYFSRYVRSKKVFGSMIVLSVLIIITLINLLEISESSNKVEVIEDNNNNNNNNNNNKDNKNKSNDEYFDDIIQEETSQTNDNTHTIFDTNKHKNYLTGLFEELIDVEPNFDNLPSDYPKAPEMAPWDDHPMLTYEYLSSSYLTITDQQVKNLKEKHELFMNKLNGSSSKLFFKDDDNNEFFIPNSNGIVYVGGGKYSWFALLSIKHLRNLGSKLPVEVYIPFEEEYEVEFCEKVLPKMNAKCLKMYEILDLDVIKNSKFEIKGFMLKSLALLLSNFENILLLDADNVPYLNPDILFISEPFISSRFVVWPDYWERTTHPKFYEIQGIDLINENLNLRDQDGKLIYKNENEIKTKVPLHDLKGTIPNPSTESGQLLISKKNHTDVILLSLYYNIYGPKYYYHLITQWAPGQGDKDTFLAAANLLNKDYYQIKTVVKAIGYHKSNGDFRGTAQGQWNPIDEYYLFKAKKDLLEMYLEDFCVQKKITKNQLLQSKQYQKEFEEYKKIKFESLKMFTADPNDENNAINEYFAKVFDLKIKLMFIHESTPKFDPLDLILNNQITNEENDERIRFYENVLTNGEYYSFEKMQWQNIFDMLCTKDKKVSMKFIDEQKKNFGDKFNEESFCDQLSQEIEWIGKN